MINQFHYVKKYWGNHPIYEKIIFLNLIVNPVLIYFEKYKEYPHQTYFKLLERNNLSKNSYDKKSFLFVRKRLYACLDRALEIQEEHRCNLLQVEANKYHQLSIFDL